MLRKHKKSFVLLEVMIAIFILSVLILPFTFLPFKALENRKRLLVQLELERDATLAASELKEKIHKEGVILLPSLTQKTALKNLTPSVMQVIKIEAPKIFSESFERRCFLYKTKSKEQGENRYHLVQAVIYYSRPGKKISKTDSCFTYKFFVHEKTQALANATL